MENPPTTGSRKRRASIRHSLASTFSFASLSALRRHPSLAPTKTSTTSPPLTSPPLTTTKSPSASTPKPQATRSANLVSITSERVPVITVDSPPTVQMEDAPEYAEYDTSEEERPQRKRRERRTTINDARFLALLTMDISHPVFLGSSYSGDVRDLPGCSGGRNGKDVGAGGGASVKDVIELLERVEGEFGIATARVGEGVKDLWDEIIEIKRRRYEARIYDQRIYR